MKQNLIRVGKAMLLLAVCLAGGCTHPVVDQSSIAAERTERRNKLAPIVVEAWGIKEKGDWPQVLVDHRITSIDEARKAFLYAIKDGKIFEFANLRVENLVLVEPSKLARCGMVTSITPTKYLNA